MLIPADCCACSMRPFIASLNNPSPPTRITLWMKKQKVRKTGQKDVDRRNENR